MQTLSIDIETYSSISLQKSGVYRYVEAPDFEILLFGYSVDSGPVQVIDLACGEKIPKDIIEALTDDTVIKWAFNANFERICLSQHLKNLGISLDPFHDNHPLSTECARYLNPESWRCSMIWSATMGLPLSLEGVGAVLGLEKQKLTEGKDLIKFFCQPCAPTKANGQRTRNYPYHAQEKWAAFKRYNIRDVEAEMSIQERLQKFPVPDSVWEEYHIDQEINDRGVAIDLPLVRQAIDMDARSRAELTDAMRELTELDNPNSVQQMKQWLSDNGLETDSLGKKIVAELIKTAPPELQRVLMLRQQLAKSSVKKYQAMINAVCADGRARGMFQFYGANRTGRWAGRLIQLQNLPQNHLADLADARSLVRSGDYDSVEMLYEDVPDTLSQLIRTAFIPKDGNKLIVSDFSAIEARVIAWMAGENWRQEVFAKGGDIYCASASQMFKVPVEKHGINGHLRQKGKIAELALGYGGSVGALKAMGALEMGLTEDELPQVGDFLLSFIPVFTGIISVSGKPLSAFAYNATLVGVVEAVSFTAQNLLIPLSGVYLALCLTGAVSDQIQIGGITRSIKKVVLWALGFLMTIFIAILTIKSFVANSADSVTLRAGKYLIGSFVPVVGGAVSDALTVLQGSFAVVRSTVGAFGILAILICFLPGIVSILLMNAALKIAQIVSDMLNVKRVSGLLEATSFVLTLMQSILICYGVMVLISISLMLVLGLGL